MRKCLEGREKSSAKNISTRVRLHGEETETLGIGPCFKVEEEWGQSSGQREVGDTAERTPFSPLGKRSVLHLIPINSTSREDSDVTEIMWEPVLRHGGGLEPQGHVVGVRETGMYLLYSQVLFHDITFTMGQVLYREGQGREILSRCVCSMPSNLHQAYNSCYTAGVFRLYQGDILSFTIPRAGAKLDLTPHGTFLGLVKL
ncbi:tumor necrosis factor ligand superfamily member 13 isoform X2 [Petaurus breviceps papuanus]|uniref:tumor necrosis factor ligand superfamily member 13 isoform X2 n=1 Tax=Petaurus breviceps papuanus TaxID=3040969 RepID=UPI0036D953B9